MATYSAARHGVTFSQAYEEAMAMAKLDYVMIDCYELRHSGFKNADGTLYVPRIANNYDDVVATLEGDAPANPGETVTFIALPVTAGGMDESDSGQAPALTISFDGVSPLIVQQLDYALDGLEPIQISVRIYASNDFTAPAFLPVLHLTLRDVSISETKVTARATFYDPSNHGFPKQEFTQRRYPGLSSR